MGRKKGHDLLTFSSRNTTTPPLISLLTDVGLQQETIRFDFTPLCFSLADFR